MSCQRKLVPWQGSKRKFGDTQFSDVDNLKKLEGRVTAFWSIVKAYTMFDFHLQMSSKDGHCWGFGYVCMCACVCVQKHTNIRMNVFVTKIVLIGKIIQYRDY